MFKLEIDEIEKLNDLIKEYPGKVGGIISNVLHEEGAEEIKNQIALLLPSSGRTWSKKGAPASAVMPGRFSQKNDPSSVTISAKGKYGYLYFPDDGSNTKRHAGNQQFMARGAENASAKIIELCVGKLVDTFNGG